MAEPVILSSSPSLNETDVFLNASINITFSAALTPTTVNNNSVALIDVGADYIVNTVISYADNVVTITPIGVLVDNTVYKVRFLGLDAAINSSHPIQDQASGDRLSTTLERLFTTGTRVYINDSTVNKDAADLSLEGDLRLPQNIKALGHLAIDKTYPKNLSHDNPTTLTGDNRFYITFNKDLDTGLLSDDWLEVEIFPVLDMHEYLASGNLFNNPSIPEVQSITATGSMLYIQLDGELPQNAGVEVLFSEDITAADSSILGKNDFKFLFGTDRFPKVSGVRTVKKELPAVADELTNTYISCLLFKATLEYMYRFRVAAADVMPSFRGMRWITLRALLDILDDKELEKALVAGTRRQLGDLNVSVDAIVGKAALKRQRVVDEIDEIERGIAGKDRLIKIYWETSYINETIDRQWHGIHGKLVDSKWMTYQPNMPVSNIGINRQAKVPPTTWWI